VPHEEELHPPQEFPPIGAVNPVLSLARQEKHEMARWDSLPHFGQLAFSSDWLMGRISSNFEAHLGQTYS